MKAHKYAHMHAWKIGLRPTFRHPFWKGENKGKRKGGKQEGGMFFSMHWPLLSFPALQRSNPCRISLLEVNNWLRVPEAEGRGTVAGSNKCWLHFRGNSVQQVNTLLFGLRVIMGGARCLSVALSLRGGVLCLGDSQRLKVILNFAVTYLLFFLQV